ncbi:MAG: ABC transporter substrate-binding protein [Anaerolineae bacterium]
MYRLYRVAYKPCVLILALFLLLPLGACKPPQPVKDVTIRFALPSQFSPDPADNQALADRYKAVAAAFHEQNPHITVELIPQTWEQLAALTAVDFDVLFLDAFSYTGLAERGIIRSLAPWASLEDKALKADYLPSVLKPFERNGELWAIPWALNPQILYYNRDLFTQAGVEAPKPGWTWNDFLEKASGVTDAGTGIYGAVILNEFAFVLPVIYQHGGRIFEDWSQLSQATFDDPLNIEALSWIAGLIYKDKVIPTQAQVIREFGIDYFALYRGVNQGKFGMWTAGYLERGGALWGPELAWKMAWGAAPLPRDAQAATRVNAWLLGISSQAADADACWEWLEYLSKQLPPDQLLPARTSLRQGMRPQDISEQESLAAGSAALEGILLINVDQGDQVIPALDAFWKAVSAILRKNEPAEEQLQQAQQKATQ